MDVEKILKTTGKVAKTVGWLGAGIMENSGKGLAKKLEKEGMYTQAEVSNNISGFFGNVKDKCEGNYFNDLHDKINEKWNEIFGSEENSENVDNNETYSEENDCTYNDTECLDTNQSDTDEEV